MAFRAEGRSKRFFQRAIVGWETAVRNGHTVIVAAKLSCGHLYTYVRTRPAGSRRSAAPCSQCGSAFRTGSDRARRRGWLRARILAAVTDPQRLDALVEFIERWPEVRSSPPLGTAEVIADMDRSQRMAGLDEHPGMDVTPDYSSRDDDEED